jgi:hypothetical protein
MLRASKKDDLNSTASNRRRDILGSRSSWWLWHDSLRWWKDPILFGPRYLCEETKKIPWLRKAGSGHIHLAPTDRLGAGLGCCGRSGFSQPNWEIKFKTMAILFDLLVHIRDSRLPFTRNEKCD